MTDISTPQAIPAYFDPIAAHLRKLFSSDCPNTAPPCGALIEVTTPIQTLEGEIIDIGSYLVCPGFGMAQNGPNWIHLKPLSSNDIERIMNDNNFLEELLDAPRKEYLKARTWQWIECNGIISEDEIDELGIDPALKGLPIQIDWRGIKLYVPTK